MKYSKWLAAPLMAVALVLGSTTPASAVEVQGRTIIMIPGQGSKVIYKCHLNYNWFEEFVLGYRDGQRSGDVCRLN